MDLPIGIRLAEVIEIHERKVPDSGASKGFDRPRTNPTKADDHHMAFGKSFQGRVAVESCDAAETA